MITLSGIAPVVEEFEEGDSWEPAVIGKIVLQHSESQIGETLHEGSVFLDGRPVCDNAWDEMEAQVVCRFDILKSGNNNLADMRRVKGLARVCFLPRKNDHKKRV